MALVKLPEKPLAEQVTSEDMILIVQRRADGKLDVYRIEMKQIIKAVADGAGIPGLKNEVAALKQRPRFFYDEDGWLTFDDGEEN